MKLTRNVPKHPYRWETLWLMEIPRNSVVNGRVPGNELIEEMPRIPMIENEVSSK